MMDEGFTDDMDDIRQIFFEECDEQLALLEDELGALESQLGTGETINTVFRCVHSIKGGSAAFGMRTLVEFSHLFESVLERFRSGLLEIDAKSIDVFLECKDALSDLVLNYRAGHKDQSAPSDIVRRLRYYLEAEAGERVQWNEQKVSETDDMFGFPFAPVPIALPPIQLNTFQFSLFATARLYEHGDDVRNILLALSELGKICVRIDDADMPLIEEISSTEAWLVWKIALETLNTRDSLEEVFDWVEGTVQVRFEPEPEPEPEPDLDKHLITQSVMKEASESIRVENINKTVRETASVRVDVQRIDKLVDLIGELVINQGAICSQMRRVARRDDTILAGSVSMQEHIIHELQENVITMRAYPIKTVFQKLGRVVRETARLTGKQVKLSLEGEDTEVDRSILERLSDPLTHMVRNAIDHGVESIHIRERQGKPPEGQVWLRAFHRSGRIIVEIQDDGAGLDSDRIYEKAIEKKVITRGQKLDPNEVYALIFAPGFSTASTVTDVSGRGVGMDVVKQSLQQINGRIFIDSELGKGTKFSISLPFTLSVIEGIIFKAEGQDFVLPVNNVAEAIIYDAGKAFALGEGRYGYPYRDGYLSVIYAAELMGIASDHSVAKICFVIENENGGKIAFIVDRVIDHSRFVVKNLEENYRKMGCFSSATILGDGNVAFIVDVEFLFSEFLKKRDGLIEEHIL